MVFKVLFCLHLWVVAAVPVEISLTIVTESQTISEAYDLAAVLISEHSGSKWDFSLLSNTRKPTYELDTVSSSGAVGVWQLWVGWVDEFGFTRDDLVNPVRSTELAVLVVRYMQSSHEESCGSSNHDWVAHYKCSSSGRDNEAGACRYAQRKFKRLRRSLWRVWE